MRGKVRWLSFSYTLIFAILTSHIIDIYRSQHYSGVTIAISGAVYALMTCGNIVYSLRLPNRWIKPAWKLLMPCFALYFISTAFMYNDLTKLLFLHPPMAVIVVMFGILLLAPAFWANYKVAH